MRNALSDIWAGFARFMDWAAIGDPNTFYAERPAIAVSDDGDDERFMRWSPMSLRYPED